VAASLAESLTDPSRTAALRPHMFTQRDGLMREILDHAAARGEISPAAVTPQFIGLAPAPRSPRNHDAPQENCRPLGRERINPEADTAAAEPPCGSMCRGSAGS
jgi:hypothetical protein